MNNKLKKYNNAVTETNKYIAEKQNEYNCFMESLIKLNTMCENCIKSFSKKYLSVIEENMNILIENLKKVGEPLSSIAKSNINEKTDNKWIPDSNKNAMFGLVECIKGTE